MSCEIFLRIRLVVAFVLESKGKGFYAHATLGTYASGMYHAYFSHIAMPSKLIVQPYGRVQCTISFCLALNIRSFITSDYFQWSRA
jgi:hypothetical protein